MAWTAPATVIAGQLITAAFWNTQIRDNHLYLKDNLIPAGFIAATAATAAPTGWLLCDGTSYLRATYTNLFNALGGVASPYGLPDGTHFRVPDGRGRALLGTGTGSGLTERARGDLVGEETHALSSGELAAHAHPGSSGSFTGTQMQANISGFPTWGDYHLTTGPDTSTLITGSTNKLTDNFTPAGSVSVSVASQGSGTGHQNMQPSWVAHYIIKY